MAIEGNTLSLEQVTDVLDGKRVAGSVDEIREVKNAIRAYALASRLDPWSPTDLLRAHGTLMAGLVGDAGRWRARDVGVMRGSRGQGAPEATLGRSDRAGHSTVFVEFALAALKTALEDVVASLRPRARCHAAARRRALALRPPCVLATRLPGAEL